MLIQPHCLPSSGTVTRSSWLATATFLPSTGTPFATSSTEPP